LVCLVLLLAAALVSARAQIPAENAAAGLLQPPPTNHPSPAADYESPITNALVNPPGSTNAPVRVLSAAELLEQLTTRLEAARRLRQTQHPKEAEPLLVELLAESSPDSIKQAALLELALAAKDQDELPRAQQIYAQFLSRWPNDPKTPEVLLWQGQIFRQMGLNNLALAKFYAVMTTSLVFKNDKLDYYQRLVLLAQTEIAESHYQLGKYVEAADFFARLLKQNTPGLNRPVTQFRLVRSLAALGRHNETVAQGQDFLARYPDAPEQPEVRFDVALALKQIGRNNEALQQVLALLQEQKQRAKNHPELWAYWQQRAGNEVANQLYREGDYAKALEIYITLEHLDAQPDWQVPIAYQVGLTYERLDQPEKAVQSYHDLLQYETDLGTNASPGLKLVFEMARWRAGFVQWQTKAEPISRAQARQPASAASAPNPQLATP
jgi:tetratricopeptide (TPR) repeat protein